MTTTTMKKLTEKLNDHRQLLIAFVLAPVIIAIVTRWQGDNRIRAASEQFRRDSVEVSRTLQDTIRELKAENDSLKTQTQP